MTSSDAEAYLWTDGRYFLQAERQLPEGWRLMKTGTPGTPTLEDFLAERSREHRRAGRIYRVGIDPLVHHYAWVSRVLELDIHLVPLPEAVAHPVDRIWGAKRPSLPTNPVRVHPLEYAGQSTAEKISAIRQKMSEGVDGVFVSMLDEVAWLFNIRGEDIPHCPVVLAYGLVPREGDALLFVDTSKLDGANAVAVQEHLRANGVQTRPYEACASYLREHYGPGKQRLWMDPSSVSLAMLLHAAGLDADSFVAAQEDPAILRRRLQAVHLHTTPLSLMKAIKNDVELAGMRAAHLRDGVALCRFFHWLESEVERISEDSSKYSALNEHIIAERLTAFRAEESGFLFTSFDTIAGLGPNGAIIHYRADPNECRTWEPNSVLLLDSGGQYVDGTTDVTRTLFLGGQRTTWKPDAYVRSCYTSVLRGHIAIDTAVFPENTPGTLLDSFARRSLWGLGLDYRHGTGHGVGAALNVHEGPQSISPRMNAASVGLRPGMILSNEPGYYEDGEFGIRIENLLVVRPVETARSFGGQRFLGFERLTMVPISTDLLDLDQMSDEEIAWLNHYHREVYERIAPCLKERNETAVLRWLERACAPIQRQSHGDTPAGATRNETATGAPSGGGARSSDSVGRKQVPFQASAIILAVAWSALSLWPPFASVDAAMAPMPGPGRVAEARLEAPTATRASLPKSASAVVIAAAADTDALPSGFVGTHLERAPESWQTCNASDIPLQRFVEHQLSNGTPPTAAASARTMSLQSTALAASESNGAKPNSALKALDDLAPQITDRCYLDIEIDGQPAGRIVIGVFGEVAPVSSAHFLDCCIHRYTNTSFYRIVPGLTLQAGDPVPRSERWLLEAPRLRFDRAGLVGLVRNDRNEGDGRFFITTGSDAGYLDGKYVPLGQVLDGMDTIRRIEEVGSNRPRNTPKKPVRVVRAGLLTERSLLAQDSLRNATSAASTR